MHRNLGHRPVREGPSARPFLEQQIAKFAGEKKGGPQIQFGEDPMAAVAQSDDKRERLYIQVHSEKAPEGNLRGWLLP